MGRGDLWRAGILPTGHRQKAARVVCRSDREVRCRGAVQSLRPSAPRQRATVPLADRSAGAGPLSDVGRADELRAGSAARRRPPRFPPDPPADFVARGAHARARALRTAPPRFRYGTRRFSLMSTAPQPAPHQDRRIEANGIDLHYLDYGTEGKPPLLCLHGGAVTAHWFDFVAGGFTGDYHVRALDQRGHGDSARAEPPDYRYQSYASDVAQVVEKLDLRDFVLVGHSMGGLVSLIYAATYPGRVKKMIVIDSTLRATQDRVSHLHAIGNREGSNYATNEEFIERFRVRPDGTQAVPEIIRYLA